MTTVRNAPDFESGMTATGFWAGMTVGRLVLPFVTTKLGEFRAVLLYLALSIGLELLFWLVPSFILSAIAVAFLGFFFGPMFPTAIVLTTKLTPRRLHVGTIGKLEFANYPLPAPDVQDQLTKHVLTNLFQDSVQRSAVVEVLSSHFL
jgi:fucose permease